MTVHALNESDALDAVKQTKIDLAASHRLATIHELEEGIDNHFTVTLPGYDDRYLILPFGWHWAEAKASHMITFDETGQTLDGEGSVELSALCIHAPIHRITGARVVLHTHQTWATALNMLEDNRLIPASQTAAFFHGKVVYDDTYMGTADVTEEGERLGFLLKRGCHTMFMRNHGVLVIGETVGQAYQRLYLLERVCKAQIIAMSTGRSLLPINDDVIQQVQAPAANDLHRSARTRLFFEAMKRIVDRELPGYAT